MSGGNPRRCSWCCRFLFSVQTGSGECILTGQQEINLASADNRGGTFAASSCFFLSATLFETSGNSCLPLIDLPLPGSLCGKHIDPWLLLVPLITDGLCHCQALIWCRAASPCNGMRCLKQPSDTISCKHGRLPLIIASSYANIPAVELLFLHPVTCIQGRKWKTTNQRSAKPWYFFFLLQVSQFQISLSARESDECGVLKVSSFYHFKYVAGILPRTVICCNLFLIQPKTDWPEFLSNLALHKKWFESARDRRTFP